MTGEPLRQAEAFERLERLDEGDVGFELELLTDGRLRAERAEARELIRDRFRAAELLPTGPEWSVLRSRSPGPPRELLGRAREVVAAGTLAATGWSIVDVVGFLQSSTQTGVLTVTERTQRSLFFHQGDVVWATSSDPLERLGAFLLARGKLTRDQLHAALRDGRAGVGRACVERGYLGPEELEPMVRDFLGERFAQILEAKEGLWSFARLDDAALAVAPLRLPTQALLMDGLRKMDEMRVYRQRVRNPETVVRRATDTPLTRDALAQRLGPEGAALAGDAIEILRALPGAASIQDLVRRTGRGTFEVTRAVYHLLRADLLALVRRPRGTSRPYARPDVDPRDVIGIHALALAEMMTALERTGRADELLRTVNRFFEREGGAYRELLADLRLDAEGRLDAEALLRSFEASAATIDELVDALGELLFFALLRASEILGRRRGDDLARRVRLIHGMLRGEGRAG